MRASEVKAFLINMEMLHRLLLQARDVDLNKAKVAHFQWPHFNFLLGDMFEYILLHAQRHTLQAQAAAPKF